jgi:membrane protein DedA with SNARE-associated domain
MILPDFLQPLFAVHAMPTIFVFLLLYSFTMPISEEIALIFVGILAHQVGRPLLPVILVAYPGILLSDLGYYWIARRFGGRLIRSRLFSRLIDPKKIATMESYFSRKGHRITFFCRFFVGLRAPMIIAAGILRMPFLSFLRYNSLAAALSTVLWLGVGYFGRGFVLSRLADMGTFFAVLAPIAIIVVLLLAYFRLKKRFGEMA